MAQPDIISVLAEDKDAITYRPRLNELTQSVLATILLQQIIYRWHKNKRQPFYKFTAPCSHNNYRTDDSWQEELGFSRSEFNTALSKIATKINRKDNKAEVLKNSLIVYWVDFDRKTWYEVNEVLLGERLASVYGNAEKSHYVMQESSNTDARNAGFQHYVMQESDISYCRNPAIVIIEETETNTETTTESVVCVDKSSKHEQVKTPRRKELDTLAIAIADVCCVNPRLARGKLREELNEAYVALRDEQATTEQFEAFKVWWPSDANPVARQARKEGRRLDPPTPGQVLGNWQKGTQKAIAKPNLTVLQQAPKPREGVLTPEQRRQRMQELEAAKRGVA